MRVILGVCTILVVSILAGCIDADERNLGDEGGMDETTEPRVDHYDPGWPEIGDSVVRPGVGVGSDQGGCTSNFVFKSPDNTTLYLGLAAHCLVGEEANETVTIAGTVEATVAYNSWYTMDNMDNGTDVATSENDFALIEIPDDQRHLVHPAIVHFGGPVGLAERGIPGEKVLTYGTSSFRQGIEPTNNREGYVFQSSDWYTSMHIITPGVWGDSGSAVLNSRGEALGVLIHLGPPPATNGATNLHAALEFAKEHAGIEVELATWEIIESGLLPDLPITQSGKSVPDGLAIE